MSILDEKIDSIRAVCQAFHVLQLDAFGPVTKDDFDPSRDAATFLVECEPSSPRAQYERFFGLLQALEILLGCRIDLVEYKAMREGSVAQKMPESVKPLFMAKTPSERHDNTNAPNQQ